jgi:hypothetical protein
LANALRRVVGRPPRGDLYVDAALGTIALGGASAYGVVSTGATTIEEKVEYLLRRDQDVQRQASALADRLDRLEAESPERLAELRGDMETHVAYELSAALEAYRPLRIAGTIALTIGLVCVTLAALLA